MRLREIICERLLGADHRDTKFYINPRYAEIMALLSQNRDRFVQTDSDRELRGYMIGGNLYVWHATADIHRYGRESLHTDFGVGPDAYSGRPLVIHLNADGSLTVMLGGIRPGYFVVVGQKVIDKSVRLKAAVTPPVPP